MIVKRKHQIVVVDVAGRGEIDIHIGKRLVRFDSGDDVPIEITRDDFVKLYEAMKNEHLRHAYIPVVDDRGD